MKNPSPLPLSAEPLVLQELDVLRCLARGFTNREIAHELSISVRSVTSHVRSILGELHLANRSQAALYAVEQGLVSN
jgi:DNA-binding NarL/FixJ family response regulator